jgi:hypothetical protein
VSAQRDLDDLADESADYPITTEHGELFYRGMLVSFSPGSRTGVVRASDGRELPLDLVHAVLLPAGSAAVERQLRSGMAVGYDVAWTSRGRRVSKIFALAEAEKTPAGGARSEGQQGAEGEVPPQHLSDQDRQRRDVE